MILITGVGLPFELPRVYPGLIASSVNHEQAKFAAIASRIGTCERRWIAVVTGANKGIGLEICRQLLEKGIMVVLTARDEARGKAAVSKLQDGGAKDVVFHQLDVADPVSIASLKTFIHCQFQKLDILVNNAGVSGIELDVEALSGFNNNKVIPSETIKTELRDADNLTEGRLDNIISSFLNDFRTNNVLKDTWPTDLSAYKVSKVAVAAYTRILGRKHEEMCINCVHPGYVITDITWNTGKLTVEEGAKGPVMLALLPMVALLASSTFKLHYHPLSD
ncbi:hypothetical protein LUZ62_051618 [Rhynchospora pubera]|uniref:Uncharacterized protein n=1 Tax=Rhynchospora pubera TaxID=906938 RepID=A0AAV8GCW7_9POAL|nr:hypothetical protein LUZ62_051618 [Rhynchospora pubera]